MVTNCLVVKNFKQYNVIIFFAIVRYNKRTQCKQICVETHPVHLWITDHAYLPLQDTMPCQLICLSFSCMQLSHQEVIRA
jgi:hypothetical protein